MENPLGVATEEVRQVRQEVFASVMIARTRQKLFEALGQLRKDATEAATAGTPNAGWISLAAWDHALQEAVGIHAANASGKPGYEEAYDLIEEVFEKAKEATSDAS